MNYLALVWAEGRPAREDLSVMQRELPGWIEQMDARGTRLFGRELELPDTAATVRVRDGETLVTDGPFAETKEFVAGFDLYACSDLDEAIEVAARCPVSWFQAIEIRPFADELRLGEAAWAFAREEDPTGTPYMVAAWLGRAASLHDQALTDELDAWRRDPEVGDLRVLGDALEGAHAATTVRVRDGETLLDDGPFGETGDVIVGIDVLNCADRSQAIERAATHPIARYHAVEVRPFYSG